MLKLSSNITIGKFIFDFVSEVTHKSSYEDLTDTCKITLPRKIKWKGKEIASGDNPQIKRGDIVKIELGYDDILGTVFEGFVSEIKPKVPIEITCEDGMYLLKQTIVTKSYTNVTLSQLLADILPNSVKYIAKDVNLGSFRISKASVAKVLDKIKDEYSLFSWFRNGTLYSGFPFEPSLSKTEKFYFQKTIIDNDLDYLRKEDVKIKVKAISMQPNNDKIEIDLGDEDGDQRTLHFYNLSESALKETAEREIDRLRYEGFRGKFNTFGEPFVSHGDFAQLIDNDIPDRNGTYIIKSVERTFGTSGYRQTIELDKKV